MELGRLGVWCTLESLSSGEVARFAERVEGWGYGTLWIPETVGRNALVASSHILDSTRNLVVATGIANIYARDAQASRAAQLGLNEQSDGRFLLGLGVSHPPLVEALRGHHYDKPVQAMRAYLAAMKKALYVAPRPAVDPPTVIAALGPRMLELSAEMADGALTYNVVPEHTAEARKRIGPARLLCVEQMVLFETDPARARAGARANLKFYLTMRNYQENWRRQGFVDEDWAGDGSDRLIDAMVAWGDEAAVRARIAGHWEAGADHVCIQPLSVDGAGRIDERPLEALAP